MSFVVSGLSRINQGRIRYSIPALQTTKYKLVQLRSFIILKLNFTQFTVFKWRPCLVRELWFFSFFRRNTNALECKLYLATAYRTTKLKNYTLVIKKKGYKSTRLNAQTINCVDIWCVSDDLFLNNGSVFRQLHTKLWKIDVSAATPWKRLQEYALENMMFAYLMVRRPS